MAIETALYSILSSDSGVSAIISTRIYPRIVPQLASLPALSYQQISGPREHTMSGPAGMVKSRWQINCVVESYSALRALADAVRKALDCYSGTASSTKIDVGFLDNENDGFDSIHDVKSSKRYTKILDFIIWFQESIS